MIVSLQKGEVWTQRHQAKQRVKMKVVEASPNQGTASKPQKLRQKHGTDFFSQSQKEPIQPTL